MINETATVGMLIIKDNKVLMVRHKNSMEGKYGLPAGVIKSGEKEEDAAVRELKEETGLTANPKNLVLIEGEWHENIRNFPMSYKVYKCNSFFGDLKDCDECSPEWVELSRLSDLDLLPNVAEIIKIGLNSA